MGIFGRAIKGTITVIADGLDYVLTKGTDVIENKYGENAYVQTVSKIGTSTVRVSERTVKKLADVVDGGIDAGIGYLSDNESKKNTGLGQMKTAGKDIVAEAQQGLEYTCQAGTRTTASAVKAGKYYVRGNKDLAYQELSQTKVYARNLAKVVIIGLLAFGATELDDKDEK